MGQFFIRIPCQNEYCDYHGGRISVKATNLEAAIKERDEWFKTFPPSENFTCKPQKPKLFELVEKLID